MNEQVLWGTSTKGNVYKLHINSCEWSQVANQGKYLQGFKKVVGGPSGAWGLGCDHLVYVYINSSDIPIRVQESVWENERWIPIQGWGKRHLLPVDPYGWSNEEGTVILQRENIPLPSDGWAWESEWKVDDNVKGFQTDSEGWRYSIIDFHHGFSHKKTFRSCVRRRHWVRYRTYVATERWTKVEGLHVDAMEEPITELSLGGHDLPNMTQGAASIWITTVSGRVLYRVGVTEQCPVGQSWQEISVNGEEEVVCISAGRQSLVWAVTWNGALLARQGVHWQNPKGTTWIQVPMPEHLGAKDKLVQIVCGTSSSWVISSDGEVWLRKGVTAENEVGTGWLKMVNQMKMMTVGGYDKAFGIDHEDRQIYLRSDISPEEPSGKTWKLIDLDFIALKLPSKSVSNSVCELNEGAYEQQLPVHDDNLCVSQTEQTSALHSQANSAIPINIDTYSENQITSESDQKVIELQTSLQSDLDNDLESLLHTDDLDDSLEKLDTNFGHLTFSRDGSTSDLRLHVKCDEQDTETAAIPLADPATEGATNLIVDRKILDGTKSESEVITKEVRSNGAEKVNVEWEVSKEETTESNPPAKHISFKRLRSNFGSRLKSPIAVIDKLKTAKPKEFFNDIKSDVAEQKNHILSQMKQAQSVLLGEKKLEKPENMAVSFQKAAFTEKESAMKLTFSQAEVDTADEYPMDGSVIKESANQSKSTLDIQNKQDEAMESSTQSERGPDNLASNTMADSISICSESVSLDSDPWSHYQTEPDVNEIMWTWISAGSLNIESDSSLLNWSNKGNSESFKYKVEITQGKWRDKILNALRERSSHIHNEFASYALAVERSGWSRAGDVQLWQSLHRGGHKWLKCKVELAQDSQSDASQQAPAANFTITYQWKNQEQGIFIDLNEVLYVRRVKDESKPSIFIMQTADRQRAELSPYRLCTETEESMEDWISSLSVSCSEQHGSQGAPVPPVICALTDLGDVFMCQQQHKQIAPDGRNNIFWQQLGGHLKQVECNAQGVRWAIGHNGTAYVYTGGYGGAFFKGTATSSHGINNMSDTQEMYVYENQRWRLGRGYTNNVLMLSHHPWSDETGSVERTRDGTRLPSRHWAWQGEWVVDYKTPGGVDKEGWQYARNFGGTFYPRPRLRAYLRRRRWVRRCRVVTSGPWEEVGPFPLIDISIQPDPVQTSSKTDQTGVNQNIAVWAVGSNGDLMARVGASESSPKGSTWSHVTSDQRFRSVSVDAHLNVWALSRDGGVWCRQGVTASNITGETWTPISPPPKIKLRQLSAGDTQVWTVDSKGALWLRTGVTTDTRCGAGWLRVCPDIAHVSVNADDQLYVIRNQTTGQRSTVEGTVCRRTDSGVPDPKSICWERLTGDGFTYVSARGWSDRGSVT